MPRADVMAIRNGHTEEIKESRVSNMSQNKPDAPGTVFHTFHSRAWEYLVGVHDKPARLFGLRYLEFLQAQRRGTLIEPHRRPETPAQRLVQVELDRIYREHYANEGAADRNTAQAA